MAALPPVGVLGSEIGVPVILTDGGSLTGGVSVAMDENEHYHQLTLN